MRLVLLQTIFVTLIMTMLSCATPIPNKGSEGANVFANKCGLCHAVPHPKRHTYKNWQPMLALMDEAMQKKGMDPLTDVERQAIDEYLRKNAR